MPESSSAILSIFYLSNNFGVLLLIPFYLNFDGKLLTLNCVFEFKSAEDITNDLDFLKNIDTIKNLLLFLSQYGLLFRVNTYYELKQINL